MATTLLGWGLVVCLVILFKDMVGMIRVSIYTKELFKKELEERWLLCKGIVLANLTLFYFVLKLKQL